MVYSKKISIPIYQYDLIVYIGEIEEGLKKYNLDTDSIHDKHTALTVDSAIYSKLGEEYLATRTVFLFIRPQYVKDLGILAHEAKHIVNIIFGFYGVALNLDEDEHECYFLEYIINEILKVTNKYAD